MEQYKYDSGDDRFHIDLSGQVRLEMAGMVDCPPAWNGQVHCHPFWEIVYFKAGTGEIRLKGTTLPVARQDLFLIPPLETHQFVNTGRDRFEIFYLGFGSGIRALGGYEADVAPVLRLEPAGEGLRGKLARLVESIRSAKSAQGDYRDQALLFEIVFEVLADVQRRPGLARDLSADRGALIAERARRYLESNMHRTVTVEDVAARFFLSPHYFAKKFKAEAGCGIKEYHNKVRMERALELLRDPLLSVSDVAAKLGFENVNYFTNRFREFHGASPTEKRRSAAAPAAPIAPAS